jgi:hypothetical protein
MIHTSNHKSPPTSSAGVTIHNALMDASKISLPLDIYDWSSDAWQTEDNFIDDASF